MKTTLVVLVILGLFIVGCAQNTQPPATVEVVEHNTTSAQNSTPQPQMNTTPSPAPAVNKTNASSVPKPAPEPAPVEEDTECEDTCEETCENKYPDCDTCESTTYLGCDLETEKDCMSRCEPFLGYLCRDGCQEDSIAACKDYFRVRCEVDCDTETKIEKCTNTCKDKC